jgi:hypothetical protein
MVAPELFKRSFSEAPSVTLGTYLTAAFVFAIVQTA